MLATYTASLVSIGQSKLKLLSGKQKLTPARPPARRRLRHYNNPVFVENLVENTNTKAYTLDECDIRHVHGSHVFKAFTVGHVPAERVLGTVGHHKDRHQDHQHRHGKIHLEMPVENVGNCLSADGYSIMLLCMFWSSLLRLGLKNTRERMQIGEI